MQGLDKVILVSRVLHYGNGKGFRMLNSSTLGWASDVA